MFCTVVYSTLHCIVLYCVVLYCTVLYCIVLYCTVLYCIVLYCTVLYRVVLYCIVLYCITAVRLRNLDCLPQAPMKAGAVPRTLTALHYADTLVRSCLEPRSSRVGQYYQH